ncbi:MAG: excinuclease ABC subunit UvrC [Nitrospirae bacterium]|nr:excinuclease ABC subunit UvrC [Candidatus Manganitrophaceae bacterium]
MDLKEKLNTLSKSPGVYLMKGARGEVLYVGKAKVLANRVRSYFQSSRGVTPRIASMIARIVDLETIVTGSELEALILENNLIKRHRPKYNVTLRDDKNYPLLRLPIKEDYPRLEKVRKLKQDGARYFGPYVPGGGLREIMGLLRRIFPIPNCTIEIDGKLDRPCIEYEIKRCLAPCTGYQSKAEYAEMIAQLILFLEGKDKALVKTLKTQMQQKSDALDFETAARLRDQIRRVERALQHQRITSSKLEDQDVIGLARDKTLAEIHVIFVRGGKVIGRKDFFFEQVSEISDEALCAGFVKQFYHKEGLVPREILLPFELEEAPLLQQWLSSQSGKSVHLRSPKRGKKKDLLQLAKDNAENGLSGQKKVRSGGQAELIMLQALLHLKKLPTRIEGYDISNIMGTHAVGSMVVFENGLPLKSDYRHFKIKTIEGANDFGMMAEVLSRRFRKKEGSDAETETKQPDLILIDGGLGQLSSVDPVLQTYGLGAIDLIGLAKERGERFERVFLPYETEPIALPPGDPATHLLMRVRDEAHRFAVSYHRKIRSKAMTETPLQKVEGIGPVRRRALLKHFGSLKKIREANLQTLKDAPAMNVKSATAVFEALRKIN